MTEERPHLLIEQPVATTTRVFAGGGGGTYPRSSYERHANKIYREAQHVLSFLREREDSARTKRRYFRLELPKGESIWSTTGVGLSDDVHAEIVGAPTRRVGHLSATEDSFQLLLEQLGRYAGPNAIGRSKFAVIDELTPIPLAEKLGSKSKDLLRDPKSKVDVLLSLFPDLSHMEQRAIIAAIEESLRVRSGQLSSVTEAEHTVYLRISAESNTVTELAESFLTVQSVDPVEYTIELSSDAGQHLPPDLEVLPNTATAQAAIFDSGVAEGSRFIDGSIIGREEPQGPPRNTDHGTFVASRIIYGDSLRDQIASGRLSPDVRVLSICTSTRDSLGNPVNPTTEGLINIIRNTVQRWHEKVRVYNLSQNLFPADPRRSCAVETDKVEPLSAELDHLARKFRVLFVISAGNIPRPNCLPPTTPYPDYFSGDDARIAPPAAAVLALTTGSIADRANSGSLAPANAPSPFTRRGPGYSNFRKPDLVAHGGNYGANWRPTEDLSATGIGNYGERLSYGCGTSYAAPLTTRLAAKLFDTIPEATPELVKALLIHSAEPEEATSTPVLGDLLGNGRPNVSRLLSSSPHSQAFVYTGFIPHREIRRIAFYVPRALSERHGRRRVRVRGTVVYSPETDRTRAGYCMSHVRGKLLKRTGSGDLKPVSADEGSTIIKERYAGLIRLEKTFSSNISGGEWEFLMEHESRWNKKDKSLPVAVVLTVEDPRADAKTDILEQIRQEMPNRYRAQLVAPVTIRI